MIHSSASLSQLYRGGSCHRSRAGTIQNDLCVRGGGGEFLKVENTVMNSHNREEPHNIKH